MSDQERERRPSFWAIAFRYPSAEVARQVYEDVRDSVLIDEAADASVFRITIDGVSHVAIMGEAPLSESEQQRAESLMEGAGDEAVLPQGVLAQLQRRRLGFKVTGLDYFERRS